MSGTRTEPSPEYISAGGNCHPAAADWNHDRDLLAYGAGINIALWNVHDPSAKGIHCLLRAHTDAVHAVRFIHLTDNKNFLVSGGADKALCLWKPTTSSSTSDTAFYLSGLTPNCHNASINCLAAAPTTLGLLASGGADGIVKIWRITLDGHKEILQPTQTINPSPVLIPLSIAFTALSGDGVMLAMGGSRPTIQIYAAPTGGQFSHQATLSGHEGWIRALDFVHEETSGQDGILLASASQDKYIRLWRVRPRPAPSLQSSHEHSLLVPQNLGQAIQPSLSNRMHTATAGGTSYSIMFEALLVGHEDWVYSVRWCGGNGGLRLLSTSADNSVAIWEADPSEGVWYAVHRFGEISAQKGSTTATGSMGGLWNGLWGGQGKSLVALAKTGGWRKWDSDATTDTWRQSFGIGGHAKSVRGLAWSREGTYLLTTAADQTTRMHAQWQRPSGSSWHEFSRPQIHGYDLNCISVLNSISFVSGAEEKLLRVFEEPDDVAALLEKLCNIQAPENRNLMAADIPVLGLSNKAVENGVEQQQPEDGFPRDRLAAQIELSSGPRATQPPLEDHLSKKSLWPEKEKLYGHGFEINAVAVSNNGDIVATSCKASSIDHAVIRLFDARSWHQILPPLKAHTLSVTAMAFSDDDQFMLSVGRDRQWIVWERAAKEETVYKLRASNSRAHTRMILCASWISGPAQKVFMTGGRDKVVRFWKADQETFNPVAAVQTMAAVTTIDAHSDELLRSSTIAVGLENGEIQILSFVWESLQVHNQNSLSASLCPSLAVTQLAWRPTWHNRSTGSHNGKCLAVASEDNSVRLLQFELTER